MIDYDLTLCTPSPDEDAGREGSAGFLINGTWKVAGQPVRHSNSEPGVLKII